MLFLGDPFANAPVGSNTLPSIPIDKLQDISSDPNELSTEIEAIFSKYQGQTKRIADVLDLFKLRQLIQKYNHAQSWTSFFWEDESVAKRASNYVNDTFSKLNDQDQSNLKSLLRSFDHPSESVKNLKLPEGIYSGPVLNGLPHGQGTWK